MGLILICKSDISHWFIVSDTADHNNCHYNRLPPRWKSTRQSPSKACEITLNGLDNIRHGEAEKNNIKKENTAEISLKKYLLIANSFDPCKFSLAYPFNIHVYLYSTRGICLVERRLPASYLSASRGPGFSSLKTCLFRSRPPPFAFFSSTSSRWLLANICNRYSSYQVTQIQCGEKCLVVFSVTNQS